MNTETGTFMAGRTAMVRHSTCPVFLLSFVLLFCAIAAAEPGLSTHAASLTGNRMTDVRFAHLTTNDGLSQSTVTEILQDRRGFMWFGTRDGLNRYDGNAFVVYKHNPSDPRSLSANFVWDLMEDDQGYLWIATNYGGLDKFDPATERFIHYRHDPKNPNSISGDSVESIARDSHGHLWIGTNSNGLDKFDPSTATFTHYRNDSDGKFIGRITKVVAGRRGDIWFVGERGLFHLNPKTGQITRPAATITGDLAADYVYEDDAGNLWMLAWSPVVGLVKYDRDSERLTTYPVGVGAVGVASCNILADGQNGFWVSSSLGLYYFDRRTERFTRRFQHDDTDLNSLDNNTVAAVYRDRGGLLWVGTGTGLNLLDLRQQQFGTHRHVPNAPNSLSPGRVTAIYEGSDDVVWVGFLPRALDRLNRKTGKVTHYVPNLGNDNALSPGMNVAGIYKDARGYLWLGGWSAGLARLDERTGQFKHYRYSPDNPNSLLSDGIYRIYGDRSGHIWVGQLYGLSRLDPVTEQFTNFRFESGNPTWNESSVSAIYQDRSGTLWLGTTSGALIRFDVKAKTFVTYPPDPRDPYKLHGGHITTIFEDRAGTLWVGAWDGLYRAKRQTATFTQYTESQGLPSSVILGILEDKAGRLWLSTTKGISRLDPRTEVFRNYDMSDGLQGNEFSQGCYFQSPDGKMLFCGSNGFNAFFPETLRDNPYVPPIVITSLKVFNKPVPIGPNSKLKKAIHYVNSLTLPYSNNVLSFEFAALSYANSHKNRYRYKLENFEPGWNEVGSKQRLATYTNLDPGQYVLRVQGSNSDGVWNEQGVSLPILITPPWYRTRLFLSLCATLFVAMLWAAYQIRVRQLRSDFKKLQDVIESIPAMAWTARPDGSPEFLNKRWVEYTGWSPEQDRRGSGWMDAIHAEDHQPSWQKWRTSLATGEPLETEARVRCAETGEYRWFLARGVPVREKHGRILRWYGVLTDIEDRKRAEEERERLRELETELAHINRVSMVGELTASIAHEVNQPLSGVVSNGSACLRWLAANVPNLDEAREAARRIVRDGKRAGEVIARIRALTKRASTPRERLDLNETIREVLVLVGDKTGREDVSIQTKFADDLSPVSGDRVQLQQVVLNLVMNAIEAMGTVTDRRRELLITTGNIEDEVQVTVQDSGPGLDPNTMARIFEPFYTTKPTGMGMGLSISRSIAQSHGGRLWVTANDGPGTAFHFTLMRYQEEGSRAGFARV